MIKARHHVEKIGHSFFWSSPHPLPGPTYSWGKFPIKLKRQLQHFLLTSHCCHPRWNKQGRREGPREKKWWDRAGEKKLARKGLSEPAPAFLQLPLIHSFSGNLDCLHLHIPPNICTMERATAVFLKKVKAENSGVCMTLNLRVQVLSWLLWDRSPDYEESPLYQITRPISIGAKMTISGKMPWWSKKGKEKEEWILRSTDTWGGAETVEAATLPWSSLLTHQHQMAIWVTLCKGVSGSVGEYINVVLCILVTRAYSIINKAETMFLKHTRMLPLPWFLGFETPTVS